ncbi:hypothetical protein ACVINW_001360 [Bradyrhizobium sp. USDA 4461]
MDAVRVIPVDVAGKEFRIEVTSLGGVADNERNVAGGLGNAQFSDVLDGIEAITGELGSLLKRVAPSKASIEFSIEVGIESGKLTALLVKGTGKANFKIAMSWDDLHGPKPTTTS